MSGDELAEINGVKPNQVIKDGEEVEAKSQSRCERPYFQWSYQAECGLPTVASLSTKSSEPLIITTGPWRRSFEPNTFANNSLLQHMPRASSRARRYVLSNITTVLYRLGETRYHLLYEGTPLTAQVTDCFCQSRMPTNARSCKHLRSILGDAYEDARLALKNPDGAPAPIAGGKKAASKGKAASSAKPASSAKASTSRGKRKKVDDEEDEAEEPPKKAPRSARATRASARGKVKKEEDAGNDAEEEEVKPKKPQSSARGRTAKGKEKVSGQPAPILENDEEMDEAPKDDVKPEQAADEAPTGGDELAVINGIKPKVMIKDGEEVEAKSMSR